MHIVQALILGIIESIPRIRELSQDEIPGSFNFKIFHFMRLTASLGFAAKSWSALMIFVCPVNRKTASAVFRIPAMICGSTPVLTVEASSRKTTSRTQWSLFSIVQCWRRSVSKSAAEACSGGRLVIPYCTWDLTCPVSFCSWRVVY